MLMMNRFFCFLLLYIVCMAAGHSADDSVATGPAPAAECSLYTSRLSGFPTATFCVYPAKRHIGDTQDFSAASPVRYEFREITGETPSGTVYGRTVAAEVHPATLGNAAHPDDALAVLAKRIGAASAPHPPFPEWYR